MDNFKMIYSIPFLFLLLYLVVTRQQKWLLKVSMMLKLLSIKS